MHLIDDKIQKWPHFRSGREKLQGNHRRNTKLLTMMIMIILLMIIIIIINNNNINIINISINNKILTFKH